MIPAMTGTGRLWNNAARVLPPIRADTTAALLRVSELKHVVESDTVLYMIHAGMQPVQGAWVQLPEMA